MKLADLLVKMGTIVNGYMEGFQTDFYVHDTQRLYAEQDADVTYKWFVSTTSTHLWDINVVDVSQVEAFRMSHGRETYLEYNIFKNGKNYSIVRV